MSADSIVQPRPLRLGRTSLCLYIPFDPHPCLFQSALEKKRGKARQLGTPPLYTLPGGLVLFQVVGAPAAVLWLERLIASGVTQILLLSFCGSLCPDFSIGKAVVLRRAMAEEGTSRHYFPRRKIFYPSFRLTTRIKETLERQGLPYTEASVVSTDAPYRETGDWLKDMRRRRIDVVDMEASAVLALAEYRRVEAAGLMIVSDELFSGVWNDRFPPALLRDRIERYFLPFLDLLKTRRPAWPGFP